MVNVGACRHMHGTGVLLVPYTPFQPDWPQFLPIQVSDESLSVTVWTKVAVGSLQNALRLRYHGQSRTCSVALFMGVKYYVWRLLDT